MRVKYWNVVEKKQDSFYMPDDTYRQCVNIKDLLAKKDRDWVGVVDGAEGGGKSTLTSQIAMTVDRSFTQERMCLTPSEFIHQINKCTKGQAVVFDEAYTGLASSTQWSQVNKLIREMMMEMRKKNLLVLIVLPSVFYLEKYAALHRARALFHTYIDKKGRRGAYRVYNQQKMKVLYIKGKREMSYAQPFVYKVQRFSSKAPIDWELYESRKIKALKHKEINSQEERRISQRDFAVALLNQLGLNFKQIHRTYRDAGFTLHHKTASSICSKIRTEHNINWPEIIETLNKPLKNRLLSGKEPKSRAL